MQRPQSSVVGPSGWQWPIGEEGQTLVEYGLLLALIAVVCVTAITGTGVFVTGLFTNGITPFP